MNTMRWTLVLLMATTEVRADDEKSAQDNQPSRPLHVKGIFHSIYPVSRLGAGVR